MIVNTGVNKSIHALLTNKATPASRSGTGTSTSTSTSTGDFKKIMQNLEASGGTKTTDAKEDDRTKTVDKTNVTPVAQLATNKLSNQFHRPVEAALMEAVNSSQED